MHVFSLSSPPAQQTKLPAPHHRSNGRCRKWEPTWVFRGYFCFCRSCVSVSPNKSHKSRISKKRLNKHLRHLSPIWDSWSTVLTEASTLTFFKGCSPVVPAAAPCSETPRLIPLGLYFLLCSFSRCAASALNKCSSFDQYSIKFSLTANPPLAKATQTS